jgi:hypothetical protein
MTKAGTIKEKEADNEVKKIDVKKKVDTKEVSKKGIEQKKVEDVVAIRENNTEHKEESKNIKEIKQPESLNDKEEVKINGNPKEQLNQDLQCINEKAVKKLPKPVESEIQSAFFVGSEEAMVRPQRSINSIMKERKGFRTAQRARSNRANSVAISVTSMRRAGDKKATNQLVVKQFIKEYKNILKRLRITSNYLNPQDIRNVLLEEGFISWSKKLLIECECLEERIWNTLNKEELGVPMNDLMIFLAAIMNIDIGKAKELGKDALELTRTDIRQIHKEFYDYYSRKKSNAYMKKVSTLRECTFPPRLLRNTMTPRNLKELSHEHQEKG